ncbi:MAG: UDP-3-O-(3-hydroxymyristoyl)glucosamine N-acyltransferase [Planctomycetaceae bacterium]|jgi:UDP-3-O-[3-hydroxymyristoyl] glucosamine N-acyltransferase|nr:UDP-3-O-(3-hydroxymyristoyl)glucosamine N-acyltransferase [Planctomycetaceae bacterium]
MLVPFPLDSLRDMDVLPPDWGQGEWTVSGQDAYRLPQNLDTPFSGGSHLAKTFLFNKIRRTIHSKTMPDKTLSELADLVGGIVVGNGSLPITGVAPLQSATNSELTFLERADRVAILQRKSKAGAVVVPTGVAPEGFSVIQVPNVLESFEKIARFLAPPRDETLHGISERAFVHPNAKIGANVAVGHFAVIEEDVVLGDNVQIHSGTHIAAGCIIGDCTTIFPNVVLYRDTIVGSRCVIHSGAVIGAFGFGYDSSQGFHKLSPQIGNVVIGNDVEVGANATIDRATYGSTIIADGTKIDNFVMIAHNCKIGKHNLLCAHTGIAGSTTTGEYVVMAGRVGVKDHVHIGDGAVIGAMAGILGDVDPNVRIVGIPATPEKEQMRIQIALQRLPEMQKQFKNLQKEFDELKSSLKKPE